MDIFIINETKVETLLTETKDQETKDWTKVNKAWGRFG